MKLIRNLTLAATVLALAATPVAFAKKGEDNPGKGKSHTAKPDKPGKKPKKPTKPKTYSIVLKGVVVSSDAVAKTVTVTVAKGNAHGRSLTGKTITFDLANAKLSAADSDGNGVDAADLLAGDQVVVKAKLPERPTAEGTYAARQVVDQTHPAADEDEDEPAETPAAAPAV